MKKTVKSDDKKAIVKKAKKFEFKVKQAEIPIVQKTVSKEFSQTHYRRIAPVRKDLLTLTAALIVVFFIGLLSGLLFFPQKIVTVEKDGMGTNDAVTDDSALNTLSVPLNPLQKGKKFKAEINIAAVSNTGEGVLSKAVVEIIDGEGRILFNTNPFVEPDTQFSIDVAKNYAEQFTEKSLADKDIIYSIQEMQAKLVGGASAGAALTIATIAAIQGKNVRSDIAITGTILPDGSIGQIVGVMEKAYAAGQKGVKLFLVPAGQANGIVYEQKIEEKKGPGFIFQKIYYVPKQIDLNAIMSEQYGMQVIEVANISEAVKHAIE